jgi:HD superfamily phosphohydrolase
MSAKIKAWGPRRRIFRDPIHGYIVISPREWEFLGPLIDSPEFQRLRRVLQLGTTRFTYHGAEHSRFGHCMGTMWIMRNLMLRFREDGLEISPEIERNAVVAALLHDIGHGPFSHVFEQLTERKFDHEEMTKRLILETALKDRLSTPSEVTRLLEGLATGEYRWVSELLSGPLDADKMDYLLRDSHYTGTEYGLYDFQRFSQSLAVYESDGGRHLGIIDKGIRVAEALILARDRMFWSVYFHKTTRGVEKLLLATLRRAKDLISDGKDVETEGAMASLLRTGVVGPEDMAEFDDLALEHHIRHWRQSKDAILSDLSRRYFQRDLLKSRDVTNMVPRLVERGDKINQVLRRAGLDPAYYFAIDDPSLVPYPSGFPSDEGTEIGVLDLAKDGSVRGLSEITNYSSVVRLLRNEKRTEFRIHSTAQGIAEVLGVITTST